jgi:DNA repair protein RadA/Sms
MAKERRSFLCPNCGYRSATWLGRCPQCGEWDTFEEEVRSRHQERKERARAEPISRLEATKEERIRSIEEVDRVMGGGIVQGSLILLGGDPGIGKSTLTLQILLAISQAGAVTLYVSGEESLTQLRLRAQRLGAIHPNLYVMGIGSVEEVEEVIREQRPLCVVIDSVQTIYTEGSLSPPGSLAQLRDVTLKLMRVAKELCIAIFLVGHVTKEGFIAGPRILEHMVDTVLYLEGEAHIPFRILRVTKNRFGPTFEMAVFEMREKGLWPVSNPSLMFLKERPRGASGSVVTPHMAGSRPLLVEIQALVAPASQPMPRRTFLGLDPQRVSLITAVMEKRLGSGLGNKEIFLNVVGGLRIQETAPDLAVAAALLSSYLDLPVPEDWTIFGEVGLGGEVRSVSNPEQRIREAHRLGFSSVLLPRQNLMDLKGHKGISLVGIGDIREMMKVLFKRSPYRLKEREQDEGA